jgi:formylglycine-generating enzyme required for sulfatase activity
VTNSNLVAAWGCDDGLCVCASGGVLNGQAEDDDAYTDEKPQHKVYLDGYWIGKYPVTNAQYQAICERDGGGNNPNTMIDFYMILRKAASPSRGCQVGIRLNEIL